MQVTVWYENTAKGFDKYDNIQEINHKYNDNEIIIRFRSKENITLDMNNVKKFFTYE